MEDQPDDLSSSSDVKQSCNIVNKNEREWEPQKGSTHIASSYYFEFEAPTFVDNER